MKKYVIAALCACTACCGMVADKHSTAFEKKSVKVPMVEHIANKQGPQAVAIKAPEKQLYGEWTILSINKIDIDTDERAYIYLDFNNGNQVYGCNGCNAINGRFSLKGNNLSFSNMIQSAKECYSITDEKEVMDALAAVRKIELQSVYGINYMVLKNEKNAEVMRLRQLNFDLLNGPWQVKEIDGVNVMDKDIKIVIDIDMRTLHAHTQCHIIKGKVHIDALKENDVQFEDLTANNADCENRDIETQLLIKLEETVSCKKVGNVSSDMELLNNEGETVIRLQKTTLTRHR